MRLLFIGNSYLHDNGGVPNKAAEMIRATQPSREVTVSSMTRNGGYLDQWDLDKVLAEAAAADIVVLQGHSTTTTTPEKRARFRTVLAEMIPAIRAAGAEPMLYMTPAYRETHRRYDPQMIEVIREGYGAAARDNGVAVIPVGEAFEDANGADPNARLHQTDGSHPTRAGTYLAAATVALALSDGANYHREFAGTLHEAEAADLWQAARAALFACPSSTLLAIREIPPDAASC